MRLPNPFAVVVSAVVAGSACAGTDAAPAAVVTDSAGVTIVTSAAPAWGAGEGWVVGALLLTPDAAATDDLFGVAGLARTPGGGLVVVDEGSKTVRWFDADGALAGRAGGEGDGPGELRLPQALGIGPGDSVWVYDYAHRRFTWYGAEGGPARVVPLVPPPPSGVVVGRLAGGDFVLASQFGGGAGRTGLVRDTVPYVVHDRDGVLLDTLGFFPGRESMHRAEGRRMVMSVAPFARAASHAVVGDAVVVGDQTAHELRVLGTDGALRRIVRWDGGSLALTRDDVDAWIDRQVALAHSADRAGLRAQLAATPVPERRPAYGWLLPDPSGALWVAEYAQYGLSPATWQVFDAEGRWLGAVEMPGRFRPRAIGPGWIAGVRKDELDVEHVEVRLLKRGPVG